MKNFTTKLFPVTFIVPMRNSATTIVKTFDGILKQNYPIREIIVVDNVSKDNSIRIVEDYRKKSKNTHIILIKNKKNVGVGESYNIGVRIAKTSHIVFMHSDSMLPTSKELQKLTEPFRKSPSVVASYSYILHPEKLWLSYNFWMKCLMARAVGKESPGLNDKFDCIEKKAFLKVRGFDTKNYGHNIGVGAEDADLHLKLKRVGEVVLSNAKVVHLHYLNHDYTFNDLLTNRKLLARSYGRIARLRWRETGLPIIVFLIKPALAITLFIPSFYSHNLVILFIFSLWYMKKMYLTKQTLMDPKILLLPFITIFLIVYEAFWMLESFIFIKN